MREADVQAEFQELLAYPEHCFGEPASEKWLDLCSAKPLSRSSNH